MTPCGHTFCFKCITTGLEYSNRCPKCNFVIEKKEQIYPNFLLNELITKYKQKAADKKLKLEGESDSMNLNDVCNMLDVLSQKKHQLEADCKAAQAQLLREFLQQVRKHKQEQMHQLTTELSFIDEDLKRVEENSKSPDNCWLVDPTSCLAGGDSASSANASIMQDGFHGISADGLKEFTENLSKFTRYSSMRPLATLNYATDLLNGTSIVSSIEFDKDNEFFAIAGVTKKIKVFEYGTVIQDIVDIHYPQRAGT